MRQSNLKRVTPLVRRAPILKISQRVEAFSRYRAALERICSAEQPRCSGWWAWPHINCRGRLEPYPIPQLCEDELNTVYVCQLHRTLIEGDPVTARRHGLKG